ncbi:MAG: methyltransferase domain-containing protein [Herpetosiphon sp.]
MPHPDADHWNNRYRSRLHTEAPRPAQLLLEHEHLLSVAGWALDIPMGLGANAARLVTRGFRVVGIDIATVAVQYVFSRWPDIDVMVADSEDLVLPPHFFDVAINFFYLDRLLWPLYANVLKPGGILLFETYTLEYLEIRPTFNPRFLLQPGELRAAFHGWDVLSYAEGGRDRSGMPRPTARLVARRPLL